MARMPEHFIHQVQQATDIVDLIGQDVAIRQKGKDYLGLCPFHQEKTPSFSVSPTKQIFKCFGCGAGGGVFQYVMLQQKCTFPEAVRLLAERAAIPIPAEGAEPGDPSTSRAQLIRLMDFAAEFYQQQLHTPAGADALAYARKRELTDKSIERFGVGYAPDAWQGLADAARKAGYSDKQLIAAGLAAEGNHGLYDRFRHRLMLPIVDAAGRIIAFGGRALRGDERAKYLNSPETDLFDKSSNLYGMHWARQSIVDTGRAVVVEGYFDAIMPAQFGMDNVVATLGTALTERHVRRLSRLAGEVVLVFDADVAGAAAAERALELFVAQQVNVRVATIAEGKDPCDYVLSAGIEAFGELVDNAPDALEYVWAQRFRDYAKSDSLVGKRQAVEQYLRLVVNSAAYGTIDPVRQGLLVNRLSQLLQIPPEDLGRQLRNLSRKVPTQPTAGDPAGIAGAPQGGTSGSQAAPLAQRHVLEVLIAAPEHFHDAAERISPEEFTDPLLRAVAQQVWRLGNEDDLSLESLLALQAEAHWGALVTDLFRAGEVRGNYQRTLADALASIAMAVERREIRQLRSRGDDDALRELTRRLRQPDVRRRPRSS